jgi:hypothetical protein
MPVTYVTVVRFLRRAGRHGAVIGARCGIVTPEHTHDEYAPNAGVREAS